MQFGFNLPNSGALATPEIMACMAREGEALGYDYLTVTDHVALPDMAEPGYPYSESGAFYSTDTAHRHEMLTLAAWLAAITSRVRLVLAVLVVPQRERTPSKPHKLGEFARPRNLGRTFGAS